MSAPRDRSRWKDENNALLRARYLGNCFGELDQFFNHLCDTIAIMPGPRQRNAALKLARLPAQAFITLNDQTRLRAIGRSRAFLRYCGGIVTRGDTADTEWSTCGWTDRRTGLLARYRVGTAARPTNSEVTDVCSFYDDLATRIMILAEEAPAYLDLKNLRAFHEGSFCAIPDAVSTLSVDTRVKMSSAA